MHNLLSPLQNISQQLLVLLLRSVGRRTLFALTLVLALGWGSQGRVQAASPETAPLSLKTAIAQIDAAANSKNVQGVLQFYSENFAHGDGLTRQGLAQALTQLWKRYPKLTYRTELKSWRSEGNAIIAETVTSITGSQLVDGQNTTLKATLRSQQRFEGQKIVRQDILSERSQVASGAKPPTVDIILPEQVTAGQNYTFDAIVKDPLGESVLLGAAVDEPVKAANYFSPSPVDLEMLAAGGLFKVGRAPANAETRWISAVLVQENGMVTITQRLRVVDRK